jgi:hypothetical protein
MTEAEWLACNEPKRMLEHAEWVQSKTQFRRKERLFACACCRLVWDQLTDVRSRHAVEAAELFADGAIGKKRLLDARDGANAALVVAWKVPSTPGAEALRGARQVAEQARTIPVNWALAALRLDRERATRDTAIVRDLFSLFHLVAAEPRWQTPDVVHVARAMYDERLFDRMPILGDALEEAGCADLRLLEHCRQPGEHVRGCWLVDLLLGLDWT